jgi:hypothetical protein
VLERVRYIGQGIISDKLRGLRNQRVIGHSCLNVLFKLSHLMLQVPRIISSLRIQWIGCKENLKVELQLSVLNKIRMTVRIAVFAEYAFHMPHSLKGFAITIIQSL